MFKNLIFSFILIFLLSCNKDYTSLNTVVKNNTAARILSEEDYLSNYIKILPYDSNYLKFYNVSLELKSMHSDTTAAGELISSNELDYQINYFQQIKDSLSQNIDYFINYLNSQGYDGRRFVELTKMQTNALKAINEEYPEMFKLDILDIKKVMIGADSIILSQTSNNLNDCKKQYMADIKDCDNEYGDAILAITLSGILVSIIETPLGGAATTTIAIWQADRTYNRCCKTAARNYRVCMHY